MFKAVRFSRYAGDLVFARTAAGDAKLQDPTTSLSAGHLRMLAAVDGRRTVDATARVFRAGESLKLLQQLAALGLIASVASHADAATSIRIDDPTRAALTSKQFQSVKHVATDAAGELLGATARPLIKDIERARDCASLRRAIGAVSERLSRVLGADAVKIYIDSVRRAAANA